MTAKVVQGRIDPRRAGLTVLLVTEDELQATRCERAFAANNHMVMHAASVEEATGLLHSIRIDVAAVDLDLARFDGLTLIGQLWRVCPDLPVLSFGAADRPVKEGAAINAGVISHFSGRPDPGALSMAAKLAVNQSTSKPHTVARRLMNTSSELTRIAERSPQPDLFVDAALRALVGHFNADRGSLFLLDKQGDGERLCARACHGIDPALVSDVRAGDGVMGKVFATGRGQLILSELRMQPGFEDCRPIKDLRASMSVPVRDLGRTIGVINLSSMSPHVLYTPRDLEALEFLAGHLAEVLRQTEVRASQELLQQQLGSVERLALAGELSAGIAHEINNPLAFVRANLGTLQEYIEGLLPTLRALSRLPAGSATPELAQALQEAELDEVIEDSLPLLSECFDGVDRCMTIVRELKALVQEESGAQHNEVELVEVVETALRLTRARSKQIAQVKTSLEPGVSVTGNPVQLVQVLVNLINNAVDSIAERRGEQPETGRGIVLIDAEVDPQRVRLYVRDDGCGMAAEQASQVFNPLYTSKGGRGGTGLGLSIVRRIVAAHGGSIEVESELGRGTRMRIELPHPNQTEVESAAADL